MKAHLGMVRRGELQMYMLTTPECTAERPFKVQLSSHERYSWLAMEATTGQPFKGAAEYPRKVQLITEGTTGQPFKVHLSNHERYS